MTLQATQNVASEALGFFVFLLDGPPGELRGPAPKKPGSRVHVPVAVPDGRDAELIVKEQRAGL